MSRQPTGGRQRPTLAHPWPGPLQDAVLLARPNRYLAEVELAGERRFAHVPNPGRMHELMVPGRAVRVLSVAAEHRKTDLDLIAVRYLRRWVCIDNRAGGKLARRLLEAHALPALQPYDEVRAEVTVGHSRLDFLLTSETGPPCWVEVKSCTLVLDGTGRFPDAPTARGVRHLGELTERVEHGERAAVLFLVQRPDAVAIGPNDATDPDFGEALRRAAAAGVQTLAVTSRCLPRGLRLECPIPVTLL